MVSALGCGEASRAMGRCGRWQERGELLPPLPPSAASPARQAGQSGGGRACGMAWRCVHCDHFWGRRHKSCPLCALRWAVRLMLRRAIADVETRKVILAFLGSKATVRSPRGRFLCFVGTARNCRCNNCRIPVCQRDDSILDRLARKCGRGRAVAARWVHLLSGAAAQHGGYGLLSGMLLAVWCGRGPHAMVLNSGVLKIWGDRVRSWVWREFMPLFPEHVSVRCNQRLAIETLCGMSPESS